MSQENVDLVRASFQAWNEGFAALAELFAPDIEWRAIEGAPDDVGPMHGLDAVRAYAQDWFDHFDDLRLEPEELIEAGEHVIAVQRLSGRAKASGVETELRYSVAYTIRGGRIVHGREYLTRAEALEAVGVRE